MGAAASPTGELVVVHGDPHPGNLLGCSSDRPGGETGYCFVDPDGFVADRAYDLGVAIRDWTAQLHGPDARSVAEGYCAAAGRATPAWIGADLGVGLRRTGLHRLVPAASAPTGSRLPYLRQRRAAGLSRAYAWAGGV